MTADRLEADELSRLRIVGLGGRNLGRFRLG